MPDEQPPGTVEVKGQVNQQQPGSGELCGQEITAARPSAGPARPAPEGDTAAGRTPSPSPIVPAPPDLATILKRVEKLERQRKVMLAVLALAAVIAGVSLWRSSAKEAPPAAPGKIIEAERIVLLDRAGERGPSVAMDVNGLGGFAFYNAAGVKLATLEHWPKNTTPFPRSVFHLYGPDGQARASLSAGNDLTNLSLSSTEGRATASLGVTKGESELRLSTDVGVWALGKEPEARLNVSGNGPALHLSGPNRGVADLYADKDGSTLSLSDSQQRNFPKVVVSADQTLSGLTVNGLQGKMHVSASIFKHNGVQYPLVEIIDAAGRSVFQKP